MTEIPRWLSRYVYHWLNHRGFSVILNFFVDKIYVPISWENLLIDKICVPISWENVTRVANNQILSYSCICTFLKLFLCMYFLLVMYNIDLTTEAFLLFSLFLLTKYVYRYREKMLRELQIIISSYSCISNFLMTKL